MIFRKFLITFSMIAIVTLTNLFAGQAGIPTGFSASKDSQIKLTWTSNGGDTGSSGEWEVVYSSRVSATSGDAEYNKYITGVDYTDSTQYTELIDNLIPGETYKFWVRAKDGVRDADTWSSYSSEMSAAAGMFGIPSGMDIIDVRYGTLAWADYDNDNDLDLVVAGFDGSYGQRKVYRNNGDNTLTSLGSGSLPTLSNTSDNAISWADYDNDSDLDIAICGGGKARVYRNNFNGTFTNISGTQLPNISNGSIAWGDYNNDGYPDLALTGSIGSFITEIYKNNGDNTFTSINAGLLGFQYSTVAWGDFNNDGYLDLAVAGASGGSYYTKLYKNNGDDTFSDTGLSFIGDYKGTILWGDFDNDGDLDLIVTDASPNSYLYRNNGNSTFTQLSAGLPGVYYASITAADFDNDGYLDLLINGSINGSGKLSKIYKNNGNNTFTDIGETALIGGDESSVSCGDYDSDGDVDFAVVGRYGTTSEIFGRVYESFVINKTTNSVPPVPSFGFETSYDSTTVILTMKWSGSPPIDETDDLGLYYDVRVATVPIHDHIAKWVVSPSTGASVGYGETHLLGNYSHGFIEGSAQPGLKLKPIFDDTTYYWQVRTIDPSFNRSDWSTEQSTYVANIPPTVVELISPLDSFLTNNVNLVFDWTDSIEVNTGIKEYELIISDDINFGTIDYSSFTSVSQASVPSGISEGSYYFKVRAKDFTDFYGEYSSTHSFIVDTTSPTVTNLTSNIDGLITNYSNITFHWNPATDDNGISSYILEISLDIDFSSIDQSSETFTKNITTVTLSEIETDKYYARVRAIDNVGYESLSSTQVFTIDMTSPTLANITSPINDFVTNEANVNFEWNASNDGDGIGFSHYLLEVTEDQDFSLIDESSSTVLTSSTLTIVGEGLYYARVRAYDLFGYYSLGDTNTFIIDRSSPTDFSIIDPTDDVLGNANIEFVWSEPFDDSLKDYTLEISTDINFTSVITSSVTVLTTATITVEATDLYYARVKALDRMGYYTFTSTTFIFVDISPPIEPVITPSVDDLVTTYSELTFSWTESSDADSELSHYALELSTSVAFNTINYSSHTILTTSTITGLIENIYFTRVRAIDVFDNSSASISNTFVVDRTSPSAFAITAPVDNLITNYSNVVVEWTESDDLSLESYLLELSTDITFSDEYDEVISFETYNDVISTTLATVPEGIYYLRVIAFDQLGYISITSTQIITLDINPPVAPNLISPSNNYLTGYGGITFIWDDSLDLTEVTEYELEVEEDPQFGDFYLSISDSATDYEGWLDKGIYYWRVRAYTDLNGYGEYSIPRVFRIKDMIPPAKITDFDVQPGVQIKLDWVATGNDGHDYDVTNGAFEIKYTSDVTHAPGDALSIVKEVELYTSGEDFSEQINGLQINTTYYFWIRGRDDSDNFGEWSDRVSTVSSIFEDVIELQRVGGESQAIWGDYDSDGDLDVALGGDTGDGKRLKIYKNNGDNSFTEIELGVEGISGCSMSWVDLDNDSDLDLIGLEHDDGDSLYVLRNNGNDNFEDMIIDYPYFYGPMTVGDYNNDGLQDVAFFGNDPALFKNNGDFTFTNVNVSLDMFRSFDSDASSIFGDYDNDGDLDILASGNGITDYETGLYKNNGDDTFTNVNPNFKDMIRGFDYTATEFGDYDNDGDLDIALSGEVSGEDALTEVYRNDGNDEFTLVFQTTGTWDGALSFVDYDNDGDLDLTVAGRIDSELDYFTKIFRNDAGLFVDSGIVLDRIQNGSISWGDFDSDGDLDLLLTGNSYDEENYITKIYVSKISEVTSNTEPSVPIDLDVTYDSDERSLEFGWDASSDLETSSDGLYYEIKVATDAISTNPTYWLVSPLSGAGVGKNESQPITKYAHSYISTSPVLQPGLRLNTKVEDAFVYFKVRSVDASLNKSVWSEEESVYVPGIPPTQALITTPVDNLLTNESSITFNWNPSIDLESGIKEYELQISSVVSFSNIIYSSITAISTATITGLTDGIFYARVRSVDNAGFYSYSSTITFSVDVTSPTIPVIAFPADEYITTNSNITFAWETSVDFMTSVKSYEIILSTDQTFGIINYSSSTILLSANLNVIDGTYYYKLRASDVFDHYSVWSDTRVFTMNGDLPLTPVVTNPNLGLVTDYTFLEFTWTDSSDTSGIALYELEVSSDISFSYVDYSSVTVLTTATINVITDNEYYYRVRAKDNTDVYCLWTLARSFIVDTESPTPIIILTPEDNFQTTNNYVDVSWTGGDDLAFKTYHIRVSTYIDFQTVSYDLTTEEKFWRISGISDDVYYLQVIAESELEYASFSSTRIFTVDATSPSVVTITNPLTNLVTTENLLEFTWTDTVETGSGFLNYTLELSTDNLFGIINHSSVTVITTVTVTGFSDNTKYYYRVKAIDDFGNYSLSDTKDVELSDFIPVSGLNFEGVASGASIVWGDYDNDGDLDIAFSGTTDLWNDNITKIYKNNGNGTFTDLNITFDENGDQNALAWGDLDNDGDLDLFITAYGETSGDSLVAVYRNDGSGIFNDANIDFNSAYYSDMSLGDFNNDGYIDIIACGNGTALYRNNGDNTFTNLNIADDMFIDINHHKGSVAFADFNSDGYMDIILSGKNSDTSTDDTGLYINNGNETFTNINPNYNDMIKGYNHTAVEVGDYNNDGNIDFAISGENRSDEYVTEIYRNNGNDSYTVIFSTFGLKRGALSFADFDNDGDLDLMMMGRAFVDSLQDSTAQSKFRLYRNDDSDTFVDSEVRIESLHGGSIAWGDYDSDGVQDLAVTGRIAPDPEDYNTWLEKTRIYRLSLATVNSIPSLPTNLSAELDSIKEEIEFTWDKATDTETSQDGLYYEIKVATEDTTGDLSHWIVSPLKGKGVGKNRAQTITLLNQPKFKLNISLEDTTYYYQVRSVDTGLKKSDWSDTQQLYIDPIPPSKASFILPVDETATSETDITFVWNPAVDDHSGIKEYIIEVSSSPIFVWIDHSSTTVLSTATISGISAGIYYSRIKAIDNVGEYSISDYKDFIVDNIPPTVPVLTAPIDELLTDNIELTFDWDTSYDEHTELSGYKLQLSKDINFATIDYSSHVAINTATVSVWLDGTYYYRVRSYDILSNQSVWATTQVFTMNGGVPSTPLLLTPEDYFDTNYNELTFVWNVSTDTSGIALYELEISTDEMFGVINYSSNTILTTSTISGIEDGFYYFKVRSQDTSLQYSFYSSTRSFLLDSSSPTVVDIISPDDNFETTNSYLEFDWTDTFDLNFDNYTIQISTDISFGIIKYSVNSGELSHALKTDISDGSYYFRIKAQDENNYHSYSSTQTFTIDATSPTVVSITNLSDSLLTTESTITFNWTQSSDEFSGLLNYELVISTDSLFGIYASSVTTEAEAVITLPSKNKYYYRIASRDNFGNTSYSSVYDITLTNFIEDTEEYASLPGLKGGDISLADYDNDGDYDIALTGLTSEYPGTTKIYRNNGDSTYTTVFDLPVGLIDSSLSWGDFDNDGDLDFALSGDTWGDGVRTEVYRNNGNDTFEEILSLDGLAKGSIMFADYNNDGDLDFVVSGIDDFSERQTKLYTNNGDLSFSENILVNFTGVSNCALLFGDIDSDGYLDLLVSGNNGTEGVTKLYRNNGDETFTDTMQSLENLKNSAASFGDIDSDGDLDLVLIGETQTEKVTKVYRNDSGFFTDTLQNIKGVSNGSVLLGDLDSDGSLDLVISGQAELGDITEIYSNNEGSFSLFDRVAGMHNGSLALADYNDDSRLDIILAGDTVFGPITKVYESVISETNTEPLPPTIGFNLDYSIDDGDITFLWSFGSDEQTPLNGLYYEVRVATKTLTDDLTEAWIVSPSTGLGTCFSKGQLVGNYNRSYLGSNSGFKLNLELENTTYYFQVRTIDSGNKLSVWSDVQSIYVSNVKPQVVNIINPEVNLAVETNSVNFAWENSGLDTIIDYELEISTHTDFSYVWYSTITVNEEVEVTTTSIELGNHYYRLRAKDDYGLYSDYNPLRYFVRKNVIEPYNFSGLGLSETSIVWSWVDLSSVETGYGLVTSTGGIIKELLSNKNFYVETNLSPNTQYTRYAESYYDVTGSSESSNSKSVYTLANVPSSLVSVETKKHTVELSFNGLGGSSYKIERSSNQVDWVVVVDRITETKNIKTNHLLPDTEYWYSVRAYNGDYVLTLGSTTLKIRTLEVPEARLDPTKDNTVESDLTIGDKTIKPKVIIPKDSVIETVYVRITNPLEEEVEVGIEKILDADNKLEEGQTKIDIILEFNMYNLIGDRFTGNFGKLVTLEFPYLDEDQDGIIDSTEIPEETVEIYVLNEVTEQWELVGGVVDTERNVVIVELEHFSVYTLISKGAAATDLSAALVYPNPYKVGSATKFDRTGGVLFDNLTKNAKIRVYNIMGRLVYVGLESDGDGQFEWDVTNEHGKKVSSGIYIYIITNTDDLTDTAKGKLGIIR